MSHLIKIYAVLQIQLFSSLVLKELRPILLVYKSAHPNDKDGKVY